MNSVLKMQQLIVLFVVSLLALTVDANGSEVKPDCPDILNKIYQTTNQMVDQPKPWYGFLLFLPNGIVLEANNIAGGNSASSLGVNLYIRCTLWILHMFA